MRLLRLLILLGALLSFGAIAAGPASAATVEECQAQLTDLRTHTADADFDSSRLVLKLDAASQKLAAGKNADAVQKLVDFQNSLNALATAPKPKVDPATADALSAEAQRVIDCINSI
jgi:hypothetical protein